MSRAQPPSAISGFFVGLVVCGLIYHYAIIPDKVKWAIKLERERPIVTSNPECQWAQLDAHNRVLVKGDLCACSKVVEGQDDK